MSRSNSMRGLARVITAASLMVVSGVVSASAQGKWVPLAPFPKAMEEVVGSAVDSTLFVMGGLNDWTGLGVVYAYDSAGNSWTQKKPMPIPAHHIMVVESKGKIYVFGGFVQPPNEDAWLPVDNAWEYTPGTDSWKALAPMPTKRGAGGAVEVDGKIYVIGGANVPAGASNPAIHFARPHVTLGTVEEYDPATNAWRTRTAMPTARNHFVVGAVNKKIYVAGGRTGAALITRSSNTDILEEYDIATDRWALKAPMPTSRSGTAGGFFKGRLYVAGGEYQNDKVMMAFRAFEAYDPSTNRWSDMPRMRVPRHGFAGAFVGNRFHAVSGDIQSAAIPGILPYTDTHDAFEFE